MKRRFFVVYDYGEGGIWATVEADRPEAIAERFPELQVFEERPSWMSDEMAARLEARTINLERPTGLLLDILQKRE
jgi:hypothetical protein